MIRILWRYHPFLFGKCLLSRTEETGRFGTTSWTFIVNVNNSQNTSIKSVSFQTEITEV